MSRCVTARQYSRIQTQTMRWFNKHRLASQSVAVNSSSTFERQFRARWAWMWVIRQLPNPEPDGNEPTTSQIFQRSLSSGVIVTQCNVVYIFVGYFTQSFLDHLGYLYISYLSSKYKVTILLEFLHVSFIFPKQNNVKPSVLKSCIPQHFTSWQKAKKKS